MGEVQWIRLYVDIFNTSRKIKFIENMDAGDTLLVIWFKLLCLAGDINDGGSIYVTPDYPFDVYELARELRKPADIVQKALDTFERFDMIQTDDDGIIHVVSWEKYQNIEGLEKIREQNRIRKQKQRSKSRDCHVTVTEDVTECHAIEEEIEEELEKEEEIHSITLSDECSEYEKERVKLRYMGGTLGQNVVLLSDEQFDDLCERLSIEEVDKYIGIVAECEKNGKRYKNKSHYQAILDMVEKDRRIKK